MKGLPVKVIFYLLLTLLKNTKVMCNWKCGKANVAWPKELFFSPALTVYARVRCWHYSLRKTRLIVQSRIDVLGWLFRVIIRPISSHGIWPAADRESIVDCKPSIGLKHLLNKHCKSDNDFLLNIQLIFDFCQIVKCKNTYKRVGILALNALIMEIGDGKSKWFYKNFCSNSKLRTKS